MDRGWVKTGQRKYRWKWFLSKSEIYSDRFSYFALIKTWVFCGLVIGVLAKRTKKPTLIPRAVWVKKWCLVISLPAWNPFFLAVIFSFVRLDGLFWDSSEPTLAALKGQIGAVVPVQVALKPRPDDLDHAIRALSLLVTLPLTPGVANEALSQIYPDLKGKYFLYDRFDSLG